MSRSQRGLAGAAALSALVLAACGGSERAAEAPTTTQQKAASGTTTEAAPELEPITAAEERWLAQVEAYSGRVDDEITRSGAVTQATMRRAARLYLGCGRVLERAGEPGRFEPAAQFAERACERLQKAGRLLEQAARSSGPGGFVFAGTAEAKEFNRAVSGAFEAAGNGQYDLQRALGRADEIERSLTT